MPPKTKTKTKSRKGNKTPRSQPCETAGSSDLPGATDDAILARDAPPNGETVDCARATPSRSKPTAILKRKSGPNSTRAPQLVEEPEVIEVEEVIDGDMDPIRFNYHAPNSLQDPRHRVCYKYHLILTQLGIVGSDLLIASRQLPIMHARAAALAMYWNVTDGDTGQDTFEQGSYEDTPERPSSLAKVPWPATVLRQSKMAIICDLSDDARYEHIWYKPISLKKMCSFEQIHDGAKFEKNRPNLDWQHRHEVHPSVKHARESKIGRTWHVKATLLSPDSKAESVFFGPVPAPILTSAKHSDRGTKPIQLPSSPALLLDSGTMWDTFDP